MTTLIQKIGLPVSPFRLIGKYPLNADQMAELKRREMLVDGIPLEPLCRGSLFTNDPSL